MESLQRGNIIRKYGMFPTKWNLISGEPTSGESWPTIVPVHVQTDGLDFIEALAVGGAADSAHEYLLKLYLLTGKSDEESLKLCSFLFLSLCCPRLSNHRDLDRHTNS